MDLKVSCPNVCIPSSDEHREKKKRFTVSTAVFIFTIYFLFFKNITNNKIQCQNNNTNVKGKLINANKGFIYIFQ